MKQLLLLFVSILILLSFETSAQSEVSGIVSDLDGFPLIGVNVKVKDQLTGTTTGLDGDFKLNIPPDAVLIFSYIGYQSQEIAVNGNSKIDVVLKEDAAKLDEVVITALGIKRQKRSLGYSADELSGETIAKSNAPNIVNSLSGKSAGVQIQSPNGVDGGTSRITIRGNNNISANNQPLIVVDGVPLENAPGLENIGRGVDWGSAINNINAQDIENVNILKGPTAAALYGARGANGVVLITTKRGEKKRGIGIDYSVSYKVIQPYYYRDVQNKYGAGGPTNLAIPSFEQDTAGVNLYPSAFHTNEGPFGKSTFELFGFYSSGMSWGPEMLGQQVRWWDGTIRDFSPQPDNIKQYFSAGNTTTHNVSFSSGNDFGSMRVSLTRADHSAIIPNSSYHQTTANIGSTIDISKQVTADISLSYINYNRLNSPTLGDDNERSFGKGILYSWPRSYKGLEEELNFNADGSRNNYENIDGGYPFTFTPPHLWWNTYNNNTALDRNKLIGALSLTYNITDWLRATGRLGLDFNIDEFETRNQPIDVLGIQDGYYANELLRDKVLNNEFLIQATKDNLFDSPVNASLSFGGTQWQRSRYGIKAESGDWVNPWLYAFNNFEDKLTVPDVNEVRFDKKINSLYSFLNLSYSNYLFLELTGRNDWSSALPIDNNSYFYPSASLSFIPSEVFDLKLNALSFWKLRAAFAKTASDTDPFKVDFTYNTGTFGGSQTAALPTTIPPIALRPQQANSYEFGTTLGFFEDKLNIDFTYYYINSFDQILDSPLPSSSGANEIRINTGVIENKGLEAIISANVIERKNFFFQTGINLSRNRNFIKSLGDGAKILELANIWDLNGPAIAVEEGQEYGTIIGYDYVYHPTSGEPILSDDGRHYQITENRVPIGNVSPDLTGGWNMRFGYKGLQLSTLVDTKIGGDIYAGSYVIGLQTGQSPETLTERNGEGLPWMDDDGEIRNAGVILPGVYEDGTTNDKVVHYYFKYIGNTGGWGRFLSKPGVIDNTWVKLREVALSYDLSNKTLGKLKGVQNLSLSLIGRDLFYLYSSLPDRINPEASNGSGNAQGLEWASFPGTRSFSIGLNASF